MGVKPSFYMKFIAKYLCPLKSWHNNWFLGSVGHATLLKWPLKPVSTSLAKQATDVKSLLSKYIYLWIISRNLRQDELTEVMSLAWNPFWVRICSRISSGSDKSDIFNVFWQNFLFSPRWFDEFFFNQFFFDVYSCLQCSLRNETRRNRDFTEVFSLSFCWLVTASGV